MRRCALAPLPVSVRLVVPATVDPLREEIAGVVMTAGTPPLDAVGMLVDNKVERVPAGMVVAKVIGVVVVPTGDVDPRGRAGRLVQSGSSNMRCSLTRIKMANWVMTNWPSSRRTWLNDAGADLAAQAVPVKVAPMVPVVRADVPMAAIVRNDLTDPVSRRGLRAANQAALSV